MDVNRRTFLKGSAIAAGALVASQASGLIGPAASVAFAATEGERLEDFYDIDPNIDRFEERNSLFHRTRWDPVVQAWGPLMKEATAKHIQNNDPGYRAIDYAMRNAAWSVVEITKTGTGEGTRPGAYYQGLYVTQPFFAKPPAQPVTLSPDEAAFAVKKVAKFLGADLVGITKMDQRWVDKTWAHRQMPLEGPVVFDDSPVANITEDMTFHFPNSLQYVISLAFKQDLQVVRGGSTAVASSAVGQGYMKMGLVAYGLAEFLWGLGYQALPSGNGLALSGVFAVAAGLGELGRNGVIITPEFGPNVRLAKVFTNLPMTIDKPRNFGVREFCKACKKCATLCPSQSISSSDDMTKEPACMSNLGGVLKWPVNVEKCFKFWNENGVDCANCVAVCPYTKDSSYWTHALGARIAPKMGALFVKLDDLLGYGHSDPLAWWNMH